MGRTKGTAKHRSRLAAEDSDRKATWQTRAAIMGLLALLAIGGMSQLLMSISAAMSPPFGRLLVDDTDGLKTAFFGGAPHFVMCHNGAIADRNAGDAMQLFTQAAGTLGDAVTAVTLDCWEPLPSSGVTTLERFKLQPEEPAAKKKGKKKRKQTGKDKAPLAFTVANGRPPQQLPAVLFHKGAAVAPLVKAVTKNTRVKLVAASTTSHLTACIKAAPRPCVVLLAGPAALTNPSAKLSQWLAPVMEHHRKYQFAVVNASSRYLPEVRKALLAAGSGAAYADTDTDKELLTGMVVLQKVKVPVQEKPKKKGKKKADKKKKGKTGKKTGKRSKDEDEDVVDADKNTPKLATKVIATVTGVDVHEGSVTPEAVAALLAEAAAAADTAAVDVKKLPVSSVVVGPKAPTVRRAKKKSKTSKTSKKSKSDKPQTEQERLRQAARRAEARRAKRKRRQEAERRSSSADQDAGGEALSDEELAARERARREAMQRELDAAVPVFVDGDAGDAWEPSEEEEEVELEDDEEEEEDGEEEEDDATLEEDDDDDDDEELEDDNEEEGEEEEEMGLEDMEFVDEE